MLIKFLVAFIFISIIFISFILLLLSPLCIYSNIILTKHKIKRTFKKAIKEYCKKYGLFVLDWGDSDEDIKVIIETSLNEYFKRREIPK